MRSLAAAVAALLLVATGCSGADDTEPAATSEPSPTTTPTPTPTATPTPSEPPLDALDWESAVHTGQPGQLVRAGRGYFGVETRAVARLGPTGEDVWRYEGPDTDDFAGFVVDGVPVAVPVVDPKSERTYRPHRVHGLDPRTGKVRWSREATSRYTFSDGEHVVAPTCTGETTETLGECTLTAYDPRTGEVAWTRATWGNVENAQEGDGFTLLQTFPTASFPRYVVLEPDGDVRAEIDLPEGGGLLSPAGDVLATDGRFDEPTRNGCRRGITAWSTDGEVLWRRGFRTGPDSCEAVTAIGVEDGVAVVGDGPPRLLDARTGRTLWTGPVAGSRVYASWDGVVVDEQNSEQTTVGYDVVTGKELWRFDAIVGGWRTWNGYATTNYSCEALDTCTVVLDVRTGEVLKRVPGVPRTFVPGRGSEGPALLTRLDKGGYTATYGYVSLPAV